MKKINYLPWSLCFFLFLSPILIFEWTSEASLETIQIETDDPGPECVELRSWLPTWTVTTPETPATTQLGFNRLYPTITPIPNSTKLLVAGGFQSFATVEEQGFFEKNQLFLYDTQDHSIQSINTTPPLPTTGLVGHTVSSFDGDLFYIIGSQGNPGWTPLNLQLSTKNLFRRQIFQPGFGFNPPNFPLSKFPPLYSHTAVPMYVLKPSTHPLSHSSARLGDPVRNALLNAIFNHLTLAQKGPLYHLRQMPSYRNTLFHILLADDSIQMALHQFLAQIPRQDSSSISTVPKIEQNLKMQIAQQEIDETKKLVFNVLSSTRDPMAFNIHYPDSCYSRIIYLFGGATSNSISGEKTINTLIAFNTEQSLWRKVLPNRFTPWPSARVYHMSFAWSSRLYVYGGAPEIKNTVEGDPVFGDLWEFDTATETWREINMQGEVPSPRGSAAVHVIGDFVYLVGGFDGKTSFNEVYRMNLKTHRWKKIDVSYPSSAPSWGAASHVSNGSIFLHGGYNAISNLNESFSMTGDTLVLSPPQDDLRSLVIRYLEEHFSD